MSILSQLSANKRKEKVKVGDIELEISALSADYIPLFMEMQTENNVRQGEIIKEIISVTLKQAVPDATDEEINGIAMEHLMALMPAIMKVNKLEGTTADEKVLIEKLKK